MKFKQKRMETQEKKIMKRTRIGWVVFATLMGVALSSVSTTVSADDLETTAVTTGIEVDQAYYVSWTANTEGKITGEILEQSEQKKQDPLEDYTIKWGDTLSVIAEVTGLTVEELAETNKIENVDLIFAGDNLKLVNKYKKATAKPTTGELKKSAERPSNDESKTSQEVEKTQETPAPSENPKAPAPVEKPVVETPVAEIPVEKPAVETPELLEEETQPGGVVETPPVIETPAPETPETPAEESPEDEVVTVEPDKGEEVEETEPVPGTPIPAPKLPEVPEVPEVPEAPEVPETPETPETPVPTPTPEVPETPETPAIEVSTSERKVSSQLGFKSIRRHNPNMYADEGDKVVQQGKYGTKVDTYKVTYHDGVEVSSELVSSANTVNPVDHIVEYGTKVKAPVESLVQSVINTPKNEQYALSKGLTASEQSKYSKLTPAEIQTLANSVDKQVLNAEFQSLLNAHRKSLGLSELQFQSEFAPGSQSIATTLANYGHIGTDGNKAHHLPNGQKTSDVFGGLNDSFGVGENLAMTYDNFNPFRVTSEKHLAERFFEAWMNSSGHKQNMENESYTGFVFSTGVSTAPKHLVKDSSGVYRYVSEYTGGLSTVGVLTLVMEYPW